MEKAMTHDDASGATIMLYLLGALLLALVIALVVTALPDIKRYLQISSM